MSPEVEYSYTQTKMSDEDATQFLSWQPSRVSRFTEATDQEAPGSPFSPPTNRLGMPSESILRLAFERTKGILFSQSFVPFKFHPRNNAFEPSIENIRVYVQRIVTEEHTKATDEDTWPTKISDETYSLEIREDGNAIIKIVATSGGLHAFTTLTQLFYAHSESKFDVYTPCFPISIRDTPQFVHRGLNLDIARNRLSPADVRRTLDAMSLVRFNRLHLHATDSQSWPLEIPALPDLALKGAYDKSQIWSTADLMAVQEYGLHRGIEVYVEIDMPGHTASVHHAFPDLITAYDQRPWVPYAKEPPSGQLKLGSSDARAFITALMDDLLPRVSGLSSYFYVGGDELNAKAYTLEPAIGSSSMDVIRPFLQAFFDHVFSHLESHSLTGVVWEEMVLKWGIMLPKSTIVQAWRRDPSSLAAIIKKGYRALFGSCTYWYLDCGYGTWLEPDPGNPNTTVKPPYLD